MPPRISIDRIRDAERVQQIVGVYDCLSARIAGACRFDWLHVGGYNMSAAIYGYPDVGLMTLSENVEHVRRIARLCDRPLLVDGDDGYGNHLNVVRMVRDMEAAGASAVHMEDQVFPKKCGHMEAKRIVPAERFVDKIKAFVDTRSAPDFLLFARTDAIGVTGFDDAVERGNRYLEAGADVVFVEAPVTMEQVEALPRLIDGPLLYNWVFQGKSPLIPPERLWQLGYRFLLQADMLYAVAPALRDYYGELRATGTYGKAADRMMSFDAFNELVGLAEVQAQDRRYGGFES